MKPKIPPVIHHDTATRSMDNAALAFEADCDGVFLISMDGRDELLGDVARAMKARWPDKLIGVNYLTLLAEDALHRNLAAGLDMTWTDNAGVHSAGLSPRAQRIADVLQANPQHLFFGAVAFKYQAFEPDPAAAARMAARLGMIPCTSGSATGVAADLDKIRSMCVALGPRPLAIASGITPDNVGDYAPLVSHILVSTGVSHNEHDFDFEKLCRLVGKVSHYLRDRPSSGRPPPSC